MPNITGPALSFPTSSFGGQTSGAPTGIAGELLVSQLAAPYASLAKSGKLFYAHAILTAPVIYTTAAGTGGPLLYNPSTSNVDAYILGVGFSSSVVTTVAGGLGLTGNNGQTAAPGTTTAIDGSGNCYVGGAAPAVSSYRIGTVTVAGANLLPFAQFHTGALTVSSTAVTWVDIGGAFVIGPGCWGSVAGTATLTTLQVRVSVLWAELAS